MPGGGVLLLGLATVLTFSPITHADEFVDNISVTLQTSCTLSSTVNSAHSATLVPGVNTEGIGTTTIKTVCNDVNGFSLYAVGYTGNTVGNNVLASALNSNYDIATGTATSGETSNWSMKVNAVTGNTTPSIQNNFNNYHNVPDTYTKVASYNSATDSTDGSSVTTTYALYTNSSQMTGTYAGQVKYIMVHPSTANGHTITYNANGGTVSPSSEVVSLGSTTTLPTPTQSGYQFLGWYTAPTGGEKIGDAGDEYSPTSNIVLHAQWEEMCVGQQYIMQNISSWKSSLTTGTQVTACDTRDDNTYVVAKMVDGNVWMAQNLNLTLTSGQSLSNADTDLNSKTSWDPQATTQTSSVPSNSTTSATSYSRGDKWCYGTASNTDQTCTTTYNSSNMNATNHVGILYNWYAATAGTGTSDMVSSSATNTTDAADSICPKGWGLPTGGQSTKTNTSGNKYSFYNLLTTSYSIGNNAAGSVTMRQAPLSFIFSGYYYGGSLRVEGSDGYYWSSSAYTSSSYAYYMNSYKLGVDPQNYNYKSVGFSVRCVAK